MFVIPHLVSDPTPNFTGDTLLLSEQLRKIVGRGRGDVLSLAEALQYIGVSLPLTETWTGITASPDLNGDLPWVLNGFGGGGGPTGWKVVNEAAELQGSGVTGPAHIWRVNTDTGVSDMRVTALIETWQDTGAGLLVVGPFIRLQGNGTMTGYSPIIIANNGVTTVSIQRFVDGVGQTQVGPSVVVVPHNNMTIGLQAEGPLLGLYFDGVRLVSQSDPAGILTGRFFGLQGVATTTNKVRVTTVSAAHPSVGATGAAIETVSLAEALRRDVGHHSLETINLTEALNVRAVIPRTLPEAAALSESLRAAASRHPSGADTVGLFEALGIEVQTSSPEFAEPLVLTEALTPRISEKAKQELLALTESLNRVFLGQTRVGIIQLRDESVLVSGAGRRAHITAGGKCTMPIPERTGFEYTADLIGRDGVIVLPIDLAVLEITLYNLADLAIINGINRIGALNLGKGSLNTEGHLVITLDAIDTPILDATQPHEHHVLLVEGSYDGAQRAFRRAIDHVVVNMDKVP